MNTPIKLNRWIVWSAVAVLVAVVLVACGGGEQETVTAERRASPLAAAGLGQAITWTPASITDTANPGSRQSIPVTLTSSANVSNVVITVVPELQSLVTVAPSSFSSLQQGQVTTITITVAPQSNRALGVVQGTIQVRLGTAIIATPLPVTVAVVAPEIINGIAVPPEPPANLNDATLAGFDANGNGIRDDVERIIAKQFGGTSDYPFAAAYAKAYQAKIVAATPATRGDALILAGKELCATEDSSDRLQDFAMDGIMETTPARKVAVRSFNDVLVGFIPQELPPCAQ